MNSPPREPLFNLPGALTALLVVLAVIHGLRQLISPDLDEWVIWAFGFVPARFDASLLMGARFPGGAGAKAWSFVTYALLHADLSHLAFNALWLLPFGSAVARRFGAVRFYVFMVVTAAAGAAAHLVSHLHELAPMVGISAAVSGAMAAAIRFAFVRGGFLGLRRGDAELAAYVPALPLMESLRNPRVVIFLAVWFGINLIFGIGSITFAGAVQSIAWQAHIGGFVSGLLLFSLFDPIPHSSQ
ncbi:MAG: rhomboid family intramembrane serine protease [Xanthobacteraceae bacterium]|nr:MAG: rhomboid family intramembrane serine protease [Xanthobacteraceae bacterium]